MMVGRPQEFYHELYGDLSYLDFIRYAKNRETVIYAGANDGMLHAFTSWFSMEDADGNLSYKQPGSNSGFPAPDNTVPGTLVSGESVGDEI